MNWRARWECHPTSRSERCSSDRPAYPFHNRPNTGSSGALAALRAGTQLDVVISKTEEDGKGHTKVWVTLADQA